MSKKYKRDQEVVKKYEHKYKFLSELRFHLILKIQRRTKCLNRILDSYVFKQYLFQDELIQISSLNDLINSYNYRRNITPMYLDKEMYKFVTEEMSKLWDQSLEIYGTYKYLRSKCIQCRKYYSRHRLILGDQVRPPLRKNIPSALEEDVLDCLTLISEKYKIFYFYSHRIDFCRNDELYTLEFDYY